MFKSFFIGIALIGVSQISHAEPLTEMRIVRVTDLDLSTREGVVELRLRIAEACGDASNVDPAGRNDIRKCRAGAAQAAQQYAERVNNGEVRLATIEQ